MHFRFRRERFNFAKCPFAHSEGGTIPIDYIFYVIEQALP